MADSTISAKMQTSLGVRPKGLVPPLKTRLHIWKNAKMNMGVTP